MTSNIGRSIGQERQTFQPSYSRDLGHDLVRDFFEPCLLGATRYDRATGDFCSSFLSAGALGFSEFFINGGEMRLITNGRFTESDYQALERGAVLSDVMERVVDRELETLDELAQNDFRRRHVEVFAWLLREGRIKLKVALVKKNGQVVPFHESLGVFHSKVGIFYWDDGDIISFIGGLNESQRALVHNSESFDPAYSWQGHEERIRKHIQQFETLWTNASPHCEVLEFPEAAARQLVSRYAPSTAPSPISEEELEEYQNETPAQDDQPLAYELREYQQVRVDEWESRGRRGILSMATGTGKTFTAIAAAQRWIQEDPSRPHLVIVSGPQQHIVQQWAREIQKFTGREAISSVDHKSWQEDLGNWLLKAKLAATDEDLWMAVTNEGLVSHVVDGLKALALDTDIPILVIGDEAHSLGTEASMSRLEEVQSACAATLGLTATPNRHFDDDGTNRLFQFFGPELASYSLADAIADGWLCPYEYRFVVAELTEDEFDEYKRLTAKMKPYLMDKDKSIDYAMLQRANLLSDAQCKVEYLESFLSGPREQRVLFYTSPHLLDTVSRHVGEAGYRRAQITYRTKTRDRMPILEGFSTGKYDALVAMQCLDEGVDIPAARSAVFLASTTNPKQYIQRRGRILRRAPGKELAIVYDVLVGPPIPAKSSGKVIFRRELERAIEFARDAENSDDTLGQLKQLEVYEDLE